MKLNNLIRGKIDKPIRVLLYAENGIGKSTFASQAPSPIFIGTEDGTNQLNVVRFPTPSGWDDVLGCVSELTTEKHDFKTLVIDTVDAAEPMLWDFICKRDKQANVESYGYGRGYVAALDEWRRFLGVLERLRRDKNMHIILLGHSVIRTFKSPEASDWDRHELRLHPKASGLIKEWSDIVLYASLETFVSRDEKTKRHKAVSTGARIIHTQGTATWDAKTRFPLPEVMPLSWPDFHAAIQSGNTADPSELVGEILRKAKLVGGDIEKSVPASLEKASGNAAMLSQLNSWFNAKLLERGITQ